MPGIEKRSRTKSKLPVPVIAAIIGGIATVITALVAIIPSLLANDGSPQIQMVTTPAPTWPPLPIVTPPDYPLGEAATLSVTNLACSGSEHYFQEGVDPAHALSSGANVISATGEIIISFDLTNREQASWIKVENGILFRVAHAERLAPGDRQNIATSIQGSGAMTTKFELVVDGPLMAGDVIQSPPALDVDFFTLEPGEIMVFDIISNWWVSPGIYTVDAGLVYEIDGQNQLLWFENACQFIQPDNPLYWVYSVATGTWNTTNR